MVRSFDPPGPQFGSSSGLIFPDPFDFLTADAVRHMLRHQDVDRFLAWMRDEAPQLHPGVFARVPDAVLWPSFATSLGNGLWNAMPLPRNGYAPEPLPPQESSTPCRCQSGLTFDLCCALFPPPPPFKPEALWTFVAEQLPLEDLEKVAVEGHLSGSVLGVVAMRLVDRGASRRAARLLEKVFADDMSGLDGTYEVALDALFDAYDALGWSGKKRKALVRFCEELEPPLRGVVWARRATIEADLGDVDKAWEFFSRAQQDDPDNPSLAGLEVSLLLHQGRAQQASARSRFWLSKLKRIQADDKTYRHLQQLLQGVVENPLLAVWQFSHDVEGEQVRRYLKLLEGLADRPLPSYELEPLTESLHLLRAPASLRSVEQAWDAAWQPNDVDVEAPFDEHAPWHPKLAQRWITLLEEQPEAFDSLKVMDQLGYAARQLEYPLPEETQTVLLKPLLDRGSALLDPLLPDEGEELPWQHLENRPALRLLFNLAVYHGEHGDDETSEEMCQRLLRLSPDDPQGCRRFLVDLYLRQGKDRQALELCDEFEDDISVEIVYGRVLALFRLGEREEAAEALVQAHDDLPLVWSYLVGKTRRQPVLSPHPYVSHGGAEQAWLYRDAMLPVFKSVRGLLTWMRRTVGE